jgi:aldehyde:ferredoxin oxidoreductase
MTKPIRIKGCLAGKILRIDLTSGRVWTEETTPLAEKTLGGRGVNSMIMLREIPRGTRWNDSENLLCFAPGILVGTPAPGACRVDVSTINVFSGGKGSANAGGFWGAELKYAGYDHVIIRGKSPKPVYLYIEDDRVEIRDAGFIWGKTTFETEDALRRELGDELIECALIGPAGENLVRGSAVMIDTARAAGGSGVGCVMGDKRLKAIVVRGHGSIAVHDPAAFFTAVDHCLGQFEANRSTVMSMRQSLTERMTDMDFEGWNSIMVVRNGQDDYWPLERRQLLMNRQDGVPTMRRGVRACYTCPAGCSAFMTIDHGPYQGMRGEGFWINTVMSASRFDLADPDAVVAFWLKSNELGLDADYVASGLAWIIECFEKGLITEKDTDGLRLRFADGDVLLKLMDMMVYRRSIGDLLADGMLQAAQRIGGNAEYLLSHMKGQPSIEPFRVPKGWGLGVAASPIGGRHLRGTTRGPIHSGPKDVDFNVADYRNQAKADFWQARTKELEDILGICVYTGTWSGAHSMTPANYTELVNAGMGLDLTEEDLMDHFARMGRNLEKAFNSLHTDLGREDDLPPKRFRDEPVKSGPYQGLRADEAEYQKMLSDYYEMWGWDRETGLQTRRELQRLGLDDIADLLAAVGKLA